MNKENFIKAAVWLCGFSLSIILSAFSIFIGFNNVRHGDNTIFVIGIMLLPVVFYCAYKGFKLVLDTIFNE